MGALTLFFLRFGYDYGVSDQDELIPYVLHRLAPSLFSSDWFVQSQASGFGVRFFPAFGLQLLGTILPVWLAVLLVFIATWLCIGGAVYRFTYLITHSALASAMNVVATLVLTPRWTLGGNDLVHGLLVPSMAAWALALWGLVWLLEERRTGAAVLIGLAVWMQALVGLQVGAVAVVLLLVVGRRRSRRRRRAALFLLTLGLVAAPALVPLMAQQLDPGTLTGTTEPSLFHLMAEVRNPHHYLPLAFPLRSWILFSGLLVGGVAAFRYLEPRETHLLTNVVWTILAITLGVGVIAFGLIEGAASLTVAKLQPFKLTVLAKVVLLGGLCLFVRRRLPERVGSFVQRFMTRPRWADAAVVAGAGLLLVLSVPDGAPLRPLLPPLDRSGSAFDQVTTWAQRHTLRPSLFAVPPSMDGFRTAAERGIVVNFKAFPFQPHEVYEWHRRLSAVAPVPEGTPGGGARLAPLDAAYEALPPAAWAELAERYRIDYLLRTTPLPDTSAFALAFEAPPWHVYATPYLRARTPGDE